jgi:hypothetical protein
MTDLKEDTRADIPCLKGDKYSVVHTPELTVGRLKTYLYLASSLL